MKKLFLVRRPSMDGTPIPSYNYTFADSDEEAISKVRMKFGEYDSDIITREILPAEMNILVIGSDFFW